VIDRPLIADSPSGRASQGARPEVLCADFRSGRWEPWGDLERRAGVTTAFGVGFSTALRAEGHTAAMASGSPENDAGNAAAAAAEANAFARRRVLVFWTFQVVFWTWVGLAIVGISRMYEPGRSISFPIVAVRMAFGLVMSCCIHWIASSRLAQRFDWRMRWVIAAAATGLMLAVWLLMISERFLGSVISGEGVRYYFPPYSRIFISGVWLAIYLGLDALQRAQEAERRIQGSEIRAARAEALARANELRHLEAQMNPHFLFNALNSVVAASRDHAAVERVTQDLADYLRFSLEPSQPLEPLSREIDALEKYLSIQQNRFGADLVCRISCEPEARRVRVPPMMIQPLLENAFHYGPQTSPMPLTVSVEASVRDGQLAVIVANSGSWVPPDPARSIGSGIQTLRKRLELLIGPAATVEVVHEQGWVKIVIRLPA